MDEEGFFAVGVFDVGFWHAGLEVENGVAGGWISWRGKWGEEGRGEGCVRVEFEGFEDSCSYRVR